MKKMKRIISVILISTVGFIILYGIIFGLFTILLNIENKKNQDYYDKCKWNVTKEDFYIYYYPSIKEYFINQFKDYNCVITEKVEEKYLYTINLDADKFKVLIMLESFSDMCKFTSICYFYYENDEYNYDDIEFLDIIFTDFSKVSFYDYKIEKGVVYDIYDQNKKNNSNYYYFDNIVGNLGCHYAFCDGSTYPKINSPYVFEFEINSLFRDSNNYLNRINR